MAIAFDAVSSGGVTSSDTLTITHTMGSVSNGILLVGFADGAARTISSVTYNSVAMTQKIKQEGTDADVALYYMLNPPSGAHDVVVLLDNNSSIAGGAISYSGVDQVTPFRNAGTGATGTGTVPTVDVASAAGDVVVDAMGHINGDGDDTETAGANQTERVDKNGPSFSNHCSMSEEAGAGTVTMSWTIPNSRNWTTVGVSLQPAAAAAVAPLYNITATVPA